VVLQQAKRVVVALWQVRLEILLDVRVSSDGTVNLASAD